MFMILLVVAPIANATKLVHVSYVLRNLGYSIISVYEIIGLKYYNTQRVLWTLNLTSKLSSRIQCSQNALLKQTKITHH